MSIAESDGPPSWFLDASETVESTKYPWVGAVEGPAGEKKWGNCNSFTLSCVQRLWRNFGASANQTISSPGEKSGKYDQAIACCNAVVNFETF